jgi:PAS domain S-box-containing protein
LVAREDEDREGRFERRRRALLTLARAESSADAVRLAVETLAEVLGVARVSFWAFAEEGAVLRCLDLYTASDRLHSAGQELAAARYPNYFAALEASLAIPAVDAAADPRTREFAEGYLDLLGIRSLLDVPVRRDGRARGVICIEAVCRRDWDVDEQTFAAAVAEWTGARLEAEDRARAEAGRRESEAKVQTALEGADLGFWEWNLSDGTLHYNRRWAEMLGYSLDEAERRFDDWSGIVHPDDLAGFLRKVERLKAGRDERLEAEVRLRQKDGGWRWVLNKGKVFERSADGLAVRVVGTHLDVDDRRRAEQAIRDHGETLERRVAERTRALGEANARLRELDRLKSEFLATISHELRTPLNSIIGFAGVLLMGLPGPLNDEQRKQLGMIHSSAGLLLALINDLLDLSRIESGRMEVERKPFVLQAVLADAVRLLEPQAAAKKLSVSVIAPESPIEVVSDRKRVLQIVVNLLANAVKFTDSGAIEIRAESDDEHVRFAVADTGIGIAPENMKFLFEAFRQLDGSARRNYAGSGLGLHLCKRLLNLLGGEILATSKLGSGSVFTVLLPRTGGGIA